MVHTHANFCTSLSCLGWPIPAFHYMIGVAGGTDIRCADYATFGTAELSEAMLKALEDRSACLLANHGMICFGPHLAKAMWLAVEVETLAKQYWHAKQAGKPVILSDAEMKTVLARFKNLRQAGAGPWQGRRPPRSRRRCGATCRRPRSDRSGLRAPSVPRQRRPGRLAGLAAGRSLPWRDDQPDPAQTRWSGLHRGQCGGAGSPGVRPRRPGSADPDLGRRFGRDGRPRPSAGAIDDRVVVKVPVTRDGAAASARLTADGVRVTLTAVYAAHQVLTAAGIGAAYAAPYLGRMGDQGIDGWAEVAAMREILAAAGPGAPRLLVASLRSVEDLVGMARLGCDTFTFGPALAERLFAEAATERAAADFEADAAVTAEGTAA